MPALDVLSDTTTPSDAPSETAQRLVVAWQHPVERSIHPVGFLSFDGDTYRFGYIQNVLRVKDFRPLLGFADLHGNYRSADLFPLFAQRAMDPRRPDYHRYVERLGLEGEPGPWEQIARSQGRRQGDTLQLLPEPTVSGDELSCRFLVHGIRHVHEEPRVLAGQEIHVTREEVEGALARLAPGEKLALADEGNKPQGLLVAHHHYRGPSLLREQLARRQAIMTPVESRGLHIPCDARRGDERGHHLFRQVSANRSNRLRRAH